LIDFVVRAAVGQTLIQPLWVQPLRGAAQLGNRFDGAGCQQVAA